MTSFSGILKSRILLLLAFLLLSGSGIELSAQSWVAESQQGGFIIKKVVSDTAVATGQPFSYTIYYTIPAGATNVTISDNLPSTVMFLGASYSSVCGTPTVTSPTINQMGGLYSLSWASVPGGCTGSFTITVAFPNGVTCPGTGSRNNVCMSGILDDKTYEFCTEYVSTTAIASNPWHINKYPIGAAWQGGNCPYASGSDTLTYQVCVYKNVGTTGQLNLVNGVVTDTLPTGAVLVSSTCGATQSGDVITWNVGNLSADQMYNTVCCQFVVYYPPAIFPSGSTITNQATLTGQLGSANQPCSDFTDQSQETCVELVSLTNGSINKWVYTNRQPGCGGKYLIYICNTGTTPLIFTAKDTLPTALTGYSLGSAWNLNATLSGGIVSIDDTLSAGQCGYVYVHFTIPSTATVGSTITNCAYLFIPGQSPMSMCNSFVVDAPSSKPCLWKEVCDKQTSYEPGSTFRYRLRIQNVGGLDLTGATLTDQLDPNLEYVGNPSYYISSSWNTPCTTTPANPWSGVSLSYNSTNNMITANLPDIPAVCQDIFYTSCGMYGTAGVPFYFIEFDVQVRDSSALGNIPNNFSMTGGSLGSTVYNSNTDYVLVTGEIGFTLEKGVKESTDNTYGSSLLTTTGSNIDYRLKMNSTGTAALRYVTFADLLPMDAVTTDNKILQLCGSRGSTANYNIAYNSFLSSNPPVTTWKNPYSAGLATVNNLMPTGSPGNAFTTGCASTGGSWASTWAAGDMNLGSHFGSNSVSTSGAYMEFRADIVPGASPAEGFACNTFAASGWTKHLTQSSIVNFQLAGQSESTPVCVEIDTSEQKPCIEKLEKFDVDCKGENAVGNVEYTMQITASSCTPATLILSSPDGTFTPSTFTLASNPWSISTTFEQTSANNPVTIHYSIICNNEECRDSLVVDLPECSTEPRDCCSEFMHSIKEPHIAWTSSGAVNLSTTMMAGPVSIKKFTATIVSAQRKRNNSFWQRIFGDIVGGSLVVAPASGPQLLSIYSREAVWGPGECIDWNQGANLNLNMLFPSVGGWWWTDELRFAIRYSFTDCECVTCDTVIYYTVKRKWKWLPWEDNTGVGFIRGQIENDGKNDRDRPQGEMPEKTGLVMDDKNIGSFWVISPDDAENDVTVTGLEFNSPEVWLTEVKNGEISGSITDSMAMIATNIMPGDNTEFSLMFNNSAEMMKFPVYVRYYYTVDGFPDTLYTEPITYNARVMGADADMIDVSEDIMPDKVSTYALYITNSNGYEEGIYAVGIKPMGKLRILAVGPPAPDGEHTYIVPEMLDDGSYIISVPGRGVPGLEPMSTATPVYITVAGVDEDNTEVEFMTMDEEMQQISDGTIKLSAPISSISDGTASDGQFASFNPTVPNPSQHFATLSFTLNGYTNDVALSIVDVNGNVMLNVFDNKSLQQGAHVYGVNLGKLSSGTYFAILRTQNGTISSPITIVR